MNEIKFGTQQGGFAAIERLADGRFVGKTASRATGAMYQVYTLDRQGQRKALVDQRPNYDPRLRPWYKTATETGKATLGEAYQRFSTPKPTIEVINASLSIYDQQKTVIGLASVDLALLEIDQFLHSLEIGRSGKAFILDRSERLIASSASQNRLNQRETGQQLKATDSPDPLIQSAARSLLAHFGNLARITTSQQLQFNLNGNLRFLQVTPMRDDKGLDWLVALVVPEADFMDRINANTQTTILLCIAAFGVTTGLGVWTARKITTPILRLSRAAQAIAGGDLDQTVRVKGATEINVLAQSFNQMAQQLTPIDTAQSPT